MIKEEIRQALVKFDREDLLFGDNDIYLDDIVEVFLTISQMIKFNNQQQQINNLNKFIKEYGNYLDSLHLDDKGIVYRAREKWNLLLKGIVDNE